MYKSGFLFSMLHFPDTQMGAQKRGGKLLPVRVRTSKLADNSYVANIRVIRQFARSKLDGE